MPGCVSEPCRVPTALDALRVQGLPVVNFSGSGCRIIRLPIPVRGDPLHGSILMLDAKLGPQRRRSRPIIVRLATQVSGVEYQPGASSAAIALAPVSRIVVTSYA